MDTGTSSRKGDLCGKGARALETAGESYFSIIASRTAGVLFSLRTAGVLFSLQTAGVLFSLQTAGVILTLLIAGVPLMALCACFLDCLNFRAGLGRCVCVPAAAGFFLLHYCLSFQNFNAVHSFLCFPVIFCEDAARNPSLALLVQQRDGST